MQKVPLVEAKQTIQIAGKKQNVTNVRAAIHANAIQTQVGYSRQVFSDAPLNHFRSNGTQYRAIIQKGGAVGMLKHASMEVTLNINAAMSLASMATWWSRVRILDDKNTELWQMDADALFQTTMCRLKADTRRGILKEMAMSSDRETPFAEGDILPVGTYRFILPLLATFWSTSHLWFTGGGSWTLELTPQITGIANSGDFTQVDMPSLAYIIETEILPDGERERQVIMHKSMTHSTRFLQPVYLTLSNVTLTANTQYRFT